MCCFFVALAGGVSRNVCQFVNRYLICLMQLDCRCFRMLDYAVQVRPTYQQIKSVVLTHFCIKRTDGN
jgi:hypothetical protein